MSVTPPPFEDYAALQSWYNHHGCCVVCGEKAVRDKNHCADHDWNQGGSFTPSNTPGTLYYNSYCNWVNKAQREYQKFVPCAECGERSSDGDYLCPIHRADL